MSTAPTKFIQHLGVTHNIGAITRIEQSTDGSIRIIAPDGKIFKLDKEHGQAFMKAFRENCKVIDAIVEEGGGNED